MQGISKIALASELRSKHMTNELRYWHIHTAKMQYPNLSIADLNQLTGIPRSTISDLLESKPPKPKDQLAKLLSDLWMSSTNKYLPLKGENSFFEVAYTKLGSTYSPQTALNKLIKLGAAELHGDGINLTRKYLNVSSNINSVIKKISQFINWMIDTGLYNSRTKSENDKLFQRSYYTTKVPDSEIPKLHEELKQAIDHAYQNLKEIIDKYEIDVNHDTFEEYGVTISEFSNLFSKI